MSLIASNGYLLEEGVQVDGNSRSSKKAVRTRHLGGARNIFTVTTPTNCSTFSSNLYTMKIS